jgi:hypothetical protein
LNKGNDLLVLAIENKDKFVEATLSSSKLFMNCLSAVRDDIVSDSRDAALNDEIMFLLTVFRLVLMRLLDSNGLIDFAVNRDGVLFCSTIFSRLFRFFKKKYTLVQYSTKFGLFSILH